ncbi:MAG: Pvc16 family protein [Persicimonas sp.]
MSNAMAIAAVTTVLQELIGEAIVNLTSDLGSEPAVTAVPPDRAIGDGGEGPLLNLFMYRVSQNPGWANVDLPERDGRGRRISNPPLALDLHYMLTAVATRDAHCDVLLGYGMQAMHDFPVLPRGLIDEKLRDSDPNGTLSGRLEALARSGLSGQVEQIKLSPDFLNREETSQIWSSLQAPYRPSAFYQASVVLIQNERPVQRPLPVRHVSSRALPIRRPHIDEIIPASGAGSVIEAGVTLDIHGRRLAADHVAVRLDSDIIPIDASDVADDRIEFDVPADLSPGPHVLQVFHRLEFTDPNTDAVVGQPRPIFESNAVPFSVRPSLNSVDGSPRVIRIELTSSVQPGQRIFLTLQPVDPSQAEAVSFVVEPPTQPAPVLYAAVSGLDANLEYVARLQVDGVENLIDFDAAQGEFTGLVVQPNLDELIVDGLDVSFPGQKAKVDVEIRDRAGANVKDAEVSLRLRGPDGLLLESTQGTNSSGKVTFESSDADASGVYTAEVVDVTKSGALLNALEGTLVARGEK